MKILHDALIKKKLKDDEADNYYWPIGHGYCLLLN